MAMPLAAVSASLALPARSLPKNCKPFTSCTLPHAQYRLRSQRTEFAQSCGRSRTLKVRCSASADTELIEDNALRIEKISFGSILTPLGVGLLVYGFGAFFQLLPGADISSIMLIYGFPISVLGFALSYAQLKPVPCKTTKAAFELRDKEMTDIQKQVREDVTRFRYGDEQHLDDSLNRIFQFNRGQGIARRLTPVLVGIREEVMNGHYTLVLEFETKKDMTLEMWTDRKSKIDGFFGPGINSEVTKTEQGYDVALISDGTGAGRGGGEKKDVLPPLMPGLPARQQQ